MSHCILSFHVQHLKPNSSYLKERGIQSDWFYELHLCEELFPDAEMDKSPISALKYLCKQVDFNQMALGTTHSDILLDIVKSWIKTYLLPRHNHHTSSEKHLRSIDCARTVLRHRPSIHGVGLHSENIYATPTFDGY